MTKQLAEYDGGSYRAVVVQEGEQFVLSWTDGINLCKEPYPAPETALVRLATLIRGAATDRFFANRWDSIVGEPTFVDEVEMFFDRNLGW